MGAIVLFDGVCNFCNGSVNFMIARDKKRYFKFAPLQSEKGSEIAENYGLTNSGGTLTEGNGQTPVDSIILIEDGKIYTHSSAALRIAKNLGGAWPILYSLILVPRAVRDLLYKWFAGNRYRMFGRRDACLIPSPEMRSRFL
jgi:predicted DCC family thiol-disulfide oxidoreductase YuxK